MDENELTKMLKQIFLFRTLAQILSQIARPSCLRNVQQALILTYEDEILISWNYFNV